MQKGDSILSSSKFGRRASWRVSNMDYESCLDYFTPLNCQRQNLVEYFNKRKYFWLTFIYNLVAFLLRFLCPRFSHWSNFCQWMFLWGETGGFKEHLFNFTKQKNGSTSHQLEWDPRLKCLWSHCQHCPFCPFFILNTWFCHVWDDWVFLYFV